MHLWLIFKIWPYRSNKRKKFCHKWYDVQVKIKSINCYVIANYTWLLLPSTCRSRTLSWASWCRPVKGLTCFFSIYYRLLYLLFSWFFNSLWWRCLTISCWTTSTSSCWGRSVRTSWFCRYRPWPFLSRCWSWSWFSRSWSWFRFSRSWSRSWFSRSWSWSWFSRSWSRSCNITTYKWI